MYKFLEHPTFCALYAPGTIGLGWSADFRPLGSGRLKVQANEMKSPNGRLIMAPTLPELAKRCDEFLRVYDAEIAPNIPKTAA